MTQDAALRYHSISVVLHWAMAIGFFLMLGSGVVLEYVELEKPFKFQLYQWHKSGGLLLLASAVLRLGVRMMVSAPAIPPYMRHLERLAVKVGHWGLYAVMIAMPLSGWIMVSSSSYGLPTIVFGWFEWPHLPGMASDKAINDVSRTAHTVLAITFALMIVGHIAAVIKHRIIDKHNLLIRMWWR